MAQKKYASLSSLQTFLDNLKAKFATILHTHKLADITDYKVDTALSPTSTNPVQNKVLDAEFDAIGDAMGALELAIDGKAEASHNHDDRYYTESEIDTKLQSKSNANHNHDAKYDAKGSADASLASAKSYTDTKVSGLASTTVVDNKVSSHNTATTAHSDIRDLITGLTTRLNTLANSDDTTLDQMSEVVAYIKNNKSLIDGITTSKVNVADIVNNLTTNVSNKPLSAAQGVAIKALIDALQEELDSHGHAIADIDGLTTTLANKADKYHGTHVVYLVADPLMDGDASAGSANEVSRADHRHPTDTSRAAKTDLDSHTGNTTVHITSAERTNWNAAKTHADSAHAPSNAQANQNAFSNIKVGSTTIAADTTTDTLELVGSNVTITPDATNDKVTISVASGSTSTAGILKLTNSTSSTSTTTAATPSSVKSAYDLANTAKTNAATAQTRADSAYTLAESKVDSLSDLGITATAAELNKLDGVTATTTELNYVDGVTSNIQTQLNKCLSLDNRGTKIENATDLDTLTTIGSYCTDSSSGTNTLINCPVTGTAIRLFVMTMYGRGNSNYIKQILIYGNEKIYIRYKKYESGWDVWESIAFTSDISLSTLGITASATELNYMDGVTSNVQTQLNDKAGKKVEGQTITVGDVAYVGGVNAEIFNDYEANIATGAYSHAEGCYNKASGDYSHAEGAATISSGYAGHAEGYQTNASGSASHAEGKNTAAIGQCTHAEGSGSTAVPNTITSSSSISTVETAWNSAKFTLARGTGSHAEGGNTLALNTADHSEGYETIAKGGYSHAQGYKTQATGGRAHAEGQGSTASGNDSHAEGVYTIAAGESQHVQGKYNIEDATGTYAHIVGGGSSTSKRANINTLDWSGNAWFKGDIYVGGTGQDDANASKLAKNVTKSATLTSSSWSGSAQTVSVSGVTVNSTIIVTPTPSSHSAYGEAGVYCSGQADGTLTFECNETPTIDLSVNVLILN